MLKFITLLLVLTAALRATALPPKTAELSECLGHLKSRAAEIFCDSYPLAQLWSEFSLMRATSANDPKMTALMSESANWPRDLLRICEHDTENCIKNKLELHISQYKKRHTEIEVLKNAKKRR